MAGHRARLHYIYIVDPASSIYDDLRDRFRNSLKYSVQNYASVEELLSELNESPFSLHRTRTMVLVDQDSNSESLDKEAINDLADQLKNFDPSMNVVVLTNLGESEGDRKVSFQSSCTLVHKNPNAILKITNLIMGFISKENLERKYMAAKRSVQLLLLFVIAAILFTILAYFIFPEYF